MYKNRFAIEGFQTPNSIADQFSANVKAHKKTRSLFLSDLTLCSHEGSSISAQWRALAWVSFDLSVVGKRRKSAKCTFCCVRADDPSSWSSSRVIGRLKKVEAEEREQQKKREEEARFVSR